MGGSGGDLPMDKRQLRRAVVALHRGDTDEMVQEICGATLPEVLWLRAGLADKGRRKPQLATLLACRSLEPMEPHPEPESAGGPAEADRPRHGGGGWTPQHLRRGPSASAEGSGGVEAQDGLLC